MRDTGAALDEDAGRLTIYASNDYAREWLDLRLRRLIERTAISIAGRRIAVEFAICEEV